MKLFIAVALLSILPVESAAQDPALGTENPLAQLRSELENVLVDAGLPFTARQENSIVLMMEDRRQASEELFGELLDFSAGPTQGQDADRLNSAIDWMQTEFLVRLEDYLTEAQLSAWTLHLEASNSEVLVRTQSAADQPSQTQYVRINNNAFTTEDDRYRLGQGGAGAGTAEVIQRGGVGAYHGRAEFLLKDESLNAGRRFANNKPPYQERQTSFDISGPVVPGRLTTSFSFSQHRAENVDTIRATLPDGIFALGITRPTVRRGFTVGNTYQLADAHSLSVDLSYGTTSSEKQGSGGFTLPERAHTFSARNWGIGVRQFSSLSSRSIYETRFSVDSNHDETTPITDTVQINVFDTFNGGGAQNRTENTGRTYEFGNLYTRFGEALTVKAGLEGAYRTNRSFSEDNFLGTFNFSNLDAFLAGRPINYRVNRGEPIQETDQFELAFFIQNDLQITAQLTLMYGLRYETQTNIDDNNNFDPRLGIAYAAGQASVVRAGMGVFHQRLQLHTVEAMRRLDGGQQFEVVVDNPSYPDPFEAGTVREDFPSVRVQDPELATPYNFVAMASYERTFLSNLFFSVAYDLNREVHRIRQRNLNAPRDITAPFPKSCSKGQTNETCVRPDPDRGNIANVESTGTESAHNLRFTYRQRFSIFNLSANYTLSAVWADWRPNGILGGGNIQAGLSASGLPSDSYNLAADWGRTPSSLHNFNATVNSQLPLGVFLTSRVRANLGRRWTITTGTDDNMDTSLNDRPEGLERNTEVGPTLFSADFNISKAFFFGSGGSSAGTGTNVNLFANMTNAFNRANYNTPGTILTSRNFRRFTSAGAPREIEVGMRFQF